MEKQYCKDCVHFHQHYAFDQRKIFRVYCGHCAVLHKIRKRQPDTLACDKFIFAPPDENAFASKEYLSKALLQYLLSLELLPPIENAAEKKPK